MNIDKDMRASLVCAVRESMPDAGVSDVVSIAVYARMGDAVTTVELPMDLAEFLHRHGGWEMVLGHMRDRAKAHAESLRRMNLKGSR